MGSGGVELAAADFEIGARISSMYGKFAVIARSAAALDAAASSHEPTAIRASMRLATSTVLSTP